MKSSGPIITSHPVELMGSDHNPSCSRASGQARKTIGPDRIRACGEFLKSYATRYVRSGRLGLFRAADGMTPVVQTPVLPEATLVGPLSAHLMRPRPRSATSAIRRLLPSPSRKLRSLIVGLANASYPALCCPSTSVLVPEESASSGRCGRLGEPINSTESGL